MSDFIKACLIASKQIVEILSQQLDKHKQKYNIGAGGDISIGADLLSEEIFSEHLLGLANIDSEESGFLQGNGKDIIILDPLDGSDNYLSNIPYYGASLALCNQEKQVKEAIVVNFCTQTAIFDEGKGLMKISFADKTMSDKKDIACFLQNSYSQNIPNQAQLPTKCGIFEKAYSNPKLSARLFKEHFKFRSLGAAAISISLAYEVNFVLFGGEIRRFDCAAGLFLCKELYIRHQKEFLLISRNKQIFDMILEIIAKE